MESTHSHCVGSVVWLPHHAVSTDSRKTTNNIKENEMVKLPKRILNESGLQLVLEGDRYVVDKAQHSHDGDRYGWCSRCYQKSFAVNAADYDYLEDDAEAISAWDVRKESMKEVTNVTFHRPSYNRRRFFLDYEGRLNVCLDQDIFYLEEEEKIEEERELKYYTNENEEIENSLLAAV